MTTLELAPPVMPSSGSARRRAKAERNRQNGYDLEVGEAFRTDSIPRSAICVSVCSCGMRAWLMPGATDADHEDFDRANEDHDAYCADVNGGAW